jgi:hypothetical protein
MVALLITCTALPVTFFSTFSLKQDTAVGHYKPFQTCGWSSRSLYSYKCHASGSQCSEKKCFFLFFRLRRPGPAFLWMPFYGALVWARVEPPPAGVRPCSPGYSGSMPGRFREEVLTNKISKLVTPVWPVHKLKNLIWTIQYIIAYCLGLVEVINFHILLVQIRLRMWKKWNMEVSQVMRCLVWPCSTSPTNLSDPIGQVFVVRWGWPSLTDWS